MKRGTPDHPKTKELMAALGVRRYVAVGLLESLWHFAAQYAKRGDVGRWENTAIGTALDWDGDPDALMQAFISSGYLEECPHYRLLIHDWETHCDQTVARSEEVRKQGFARSQLAKPSTSQNGCFHEENTMLAKTSQPIANALSLKPKANAISQGQSLGLPPSLSVGRVPELWEAYLQHRREKKQTLTPTAASRAIAKLEGMGPARAEVALDHSIANGWQGIFEPENTGRGHAQGQRPKLGSRK